MSQRHADVNRLRPRAFSPAQWSTRGRLIATIVVAFLLLTTAVTAGTFLIVDRQLSTVTISGLDADTDIVDKSVRQSSPHSPGDNDSGYASIHVNKDRGEGLTLKSTTVDRQTRDLVLVAIIAPILIFGILAAALTWIIATNSQRRINMVAGQIKNVSEPLSTRHAINIPVRNDEATVIANAYNAMLNDLNESIEREKQFIANASHELKNPLAATSAALEIPLDAGLFDDLTRPFVQKALEANSSGTALVLRLLELARIQHLDSASLTDVDLAKIVTDVLDTEHNAIDEFTVTTSLMPATLLAEHTLVRRLVENLILNAMRHNIPNGSIDIVTGTERDANGANYATLTVSNTGKDLTGVELAELLAPFNRGTDSRTNNKYGVPNHGLGLSICDEIVRLHCGTLNLKANPQGGLTVNVHLPAR